MDRRLTKIFQRSWPIITLTALEAILFWRNYTPGTFFIGWDNLFPEMNFSANFNRSFYSVWQEYRGLGLLDGMSFAANLPHYLFIKLLAFFLPLNLLRYFFFFLMHLLGGLGMYRLLRAYFKKVKILSLVGALFYQYNLGTVQMFYAPYELFAVHFAFLPWIMLFILRYLYDRGKRNLLFLTLLLIFAIPQAHVPTIFIVLLFAIFVLLGAYLFEKGKLGIKKILVLLALLFSINAYWGLPFAYSALANSQTVTNSKINLMTTEDVFLQNYKYGSLANVVQLKGFMFDAVNIWPDSGGEAMMMVWQEFVQERHFQFIAVGLFGLATVGLTQSLYKRKKKYYAFAVLFLVSVLMLGIRIPVISLLTEAIFANFPIFKQVFRFIFTKFSTLYIFAFSIFLVEGVGFLQAELKREKVILLFLGLSLIAYSWPVWQGYFLYSRLRIAIPEEYFAAVEYFKQQEKSSRIALLPQPSFWGWTQNKWGYKGSGFLWYGLPQASMDGAFYPWSRENENYYWELARAIGEQDVFLLENVLRKYHIAWIILDQSIIYPESPGVVNSAGLVELISRSQRIQLTEQFNNLLIYTVALDTEAAGFVYVTGDLPEVNGYEWGDYDRAYLENGDYFSRIQDSGFRIQDNNIVYPFRSLFSGRGSGDLEIEIEDSGENYIYKTRIPRELVGGELVLPEVDAEEVREIDREDLAGSEIKLPQVLLDGELIPLEDKRVELTYVNEGSLEVLVPKIGGYYSYDSMTDNNLHNEDITKFNMRSPVKFSNKEERQTLDVYLPNLKHAIGYLIGVESKNIAGRPLKFWIENLTAKRADQQVFLTDSQEWHTEYLIQPPLAPDGVGYSLHFDNEPIGKEERVGELRRVTVNPVPYKFLQGIRIIGEIGEIYNHGDQGDRGIELEVSHPNPSFYEVMFNNETMKQWSPEVLLPRAGGFQPRALEGRDFRAGNTTLVLSQAYDRGWKAFGEGVGEHVLVNNWANGWQVDTSVLGPSSSVIIIFWPQYLQYLGFVLLLVVPLIVLKYAHARV